VGVLLRRVCEKRAVLVVVGVGVRGGQEQATAAVAGDVLLLQRRVLRNAHEVRGGGCGGERGLTQRGRRRRRPHGGVWGERGLRLLLLRIRVGRGGARLRKLLRLHQS
jgi:hypothetical protein